MVTDGSVRANLRRGRGYAPLTSDKLSAGDGRTVPVLFFLSGILVPLVQCRFDLSHPRSPILRQIADVVVSTIIPHPNRSLTIRFVSLTMARSSPRFQSSQSSAKRKASPDEPAEAPASKTILRSRVSFV